MGCEVLVEAPGVTSISCGRRATAYCNIEGHHAVAPFLCDFPLYGKAQGRTCSRPLCPSHRVRHGELDYCPVHARMVRGVRT